MEELFNIDLDKISSSSNKKEALDRKKNLELFFKKGLPNKKDESWKFTDFSLIINKNFKKIKNNHDFSFDNKIELIRDFDHNFIILVNGLLNSFDISFEDKSKVNIEKLNSLDDFKNQSNSNLNYLNKALSLGGFKIEIKQNYKCEKPIVIYNYYSSNLENKLAVFVVSFLKIL